MAETRLRHMVMISDWYPHKDHPFDGIFLQKLAQCLQLQPGWQVSTISFHAHEGLLQVEEAVEQGIHEVRIYYPIQGNKLLRHLRVYQRVKATCRSLAATYGEVRLIQANIMPFAAWYAYRLAKHLGVPWGIREGYSVYLDDQFLQFPWYKRQLTRFLAHKAAYLVSISTALQTALVRHFPGTAPIVIPNPVLAYSPAIRPPLSPPRFVSIADFYPYKKLDNLLRAFAQVSKQFPDWQLDMYGQGEQEPELRKLVRSLELVEKVHLKGKVDNASVYQMLPDYQFLVISSRVETFSNVGLEALACGVPVLSTDCGGPSDFINRQNGFLVPPNEVEHLANGLSHMMESAGNFDRKAIQQQAVESFSMEAIGRQYVTLYESILQP